MTKKYRLQAKVYFDAAHFIRDYPGKCKNMHGHRWAVEVVIEATKLDRLSMVIDFHTVKDLLDNLCDHLDHYVINERLKVSNATAEVIVEWFYDEMALALSRLDLEVPVKISRACVWENDNSCIKYYGDPDED